MVPESGISRAGFDLRLNLSDPRADRLFKNSAVAPLLRTWLGSPDRWFKLTELLDEAGVQSRDNAQRAVEVLVEAGIVEEVRDGNARLLRLRRDFLVGADPYLRIGPPHRGVVRWFVSQLEDRLGGRGGITHMVLFGSVVGGTGDRLSDIDLLVVARNPREVRLVGRELVEQLRTEGFGEGDGPPQRYVLDLLVESPSSLKDRTAHPAFPEILKRGIRIREDPDLPLDELLPEGA